MQGNLHRAAILYASNSCKNRRIPNKLNFVFLKLSTNRTEMTSRIIRHVRFNWAKMLLRLQKTTNSINKEKQQWMSGTNQGTKNTVNRNLTKYFKFLPFKPFNQTLREGGGTQYISLTGMWRFPGYCFPPIFSITG